MMVSMHSTTPVLTSTSNPRIKAAVALRERRERDTAGLTIVDGAREIRRALDAGVDVTEAYVCGSLVGGADARVALDRLTTKRIPITPVSETVFAKLAFGSRAEGLVVVARTPSTALDRLVPGPDPLILVMEGVEKPGNVGAVLRSADGAGVDAVVAASPVTDLYNPNAIRASAGTIFAVPLAAAPSAAVLSWLRSIGARIVTARVDATMTYTDVDLTGAVAIVLGAEADGLTDTWRGEHITGVRIPMAGTADSLNVSISAAILAYEARRQRDRTKQGAST